MPRYYRGRVLTRELALEVRHLAQKEETPQEVLARVYGISVPHVSNIKAERRWGDQDPRRTSVRKSGR